MKIYITSVPITDYDTALTFYTEVLGLKRSNTNACKSVLDDTNGNLIELAEKKEG